jgi:hypothetical protein
MTIPYADRYGGGFIDSPSQASPIDAQFLNAVEDALVALCGTSPAASKVPVWNNSTQQFEPGYPPGYELAYAEQTSNVTGITGTTFAGGTQIVSAGSVTFDGTAVWIEFSSEGVSNSAGGNKTFFDLSQDGTSIGTIAVKTHPSANTRPDARRRTRRLEPRRLHPERDRRAAAQARRLGLRLRTRSAPAAYAAACAFADFTGRQPARRINDAGTLYTRQPRDRRRHEQGRGRVPISHPVLHRDVLVIPSPDGTRSVKKYDAPAAPPRPRRDRARRHVRDRLQGPHDPRRHRRQAAAASSSGPAAPRPPPGTPPTATSTRRSRSSASPRCAT